MLYVGHEKNIKKIFINKLQEKYGDEYKLVGEYIDSKTPVSILHVPCGNIDNILPSTIVSEAWGGCTLCRDIINSTEKFVQKMSFLNPDIEVCSDFTGMHNHIDLSCKICGYHWSPEASNILRHGNCPNCYKQKMGMAIKGVNDLWATHPDIASMLKNSEDGYLYSYGSGRQLAFVCPNCGYEFITSPNRLTTSLKSCPRCSDGISYPEKFMQDLLSQANIDYDYQYSPDWAGNYAYDFHFFIDALEYILEMDGSFHYIEGTMVGQNDLIKNELAEIRNINIIRIDCNYNSLKNRYNYIKNNIISSLLSEIINLEKIDFDKCDIYANSSLLIKSGELWDSGIHYVKTIAEILHIHEDTARDYLRITEKYNMSTFCEEQYRAFIKELGYKVSGIKGSAPIRCVTTGEVFFKQEDAIKLYGTGISQCINGKRKTCGKLKDGTPLEWEIIPDTEASIIKENALIELYAQYKIIS